MDKKKDALNKAPKIFGAAITPIGRLLGKNFIKMLAQFVVFMMLEVLAVATVLAVLTAIFATQHVLIPNWIGLGIGLVLLIIFVLSAINFYASIFGFDGGYAVVQPFIEKMMR